MSKIYKLNNVIIPTYDVMNEPETDEQIEYEGRIAPATLNIELLNIDRTKYDDRVVGSLFYGNSWKNTAAEIYDDVLNVYLWRGRIKNIDLDDKKKTIKVETESTIADLSNIDCVLTAGSASNITPAAMIYEILNNPSMGNISADDIILKHFQEADVYQQSLSMYVIVNYTADDQVDCMTVINELQRISQMHIFTVDNYIDCFQWKPYDGTLGEWIQKRHVIQGSYSHTYDDTKLFNAYRIMYKNSSAASATTGQDAASIARYGVTVSFNVPDDEVDPASDTNYKILFKTKTAADASGSLALSRFADQKKIAKFQLKGDLKYIRLGDQIDVGLYPYPKEPMRVIERRVNTRKNIIDITAEFLNQPHQYYAIDNDIPDGTQLVAALPLYSGVLLKWTPSALADFYAYRISFAVSQGEWNSVESANGVSPILVKSTNISPDGYAYAFIYGLAPLVEYLFKVSVIDTSMNESAESNILSARPADTADNAKACKGDIYIDTLTLDETNPLGGEVPPDWPTYADEHLYGSDRYQPTAFYTSSPLYKLDGFTQMSWGSLGDAGDITFVYRTGATLAELYSAAWSTEICAIANRTQAFTGLPVYIQYMFIFHSPEWTDPDYVYVKDIQ